VTKNPLRFYSAHVRFSSNNMPRGTAHTCAVSVLTVPRTHGCGGGGVCAAGRRSAVRAHARAHHPRPVRGMLSLSLSTVTRPSLHSQTQVYACVRACVRMGRRLV
jgi:hypothetical protein